MYEAVYTHSKLSGNGKFTQLCQQFFEQRYGIRKCLLTTSCTDALEMVALLLNIQPGDEVIMPSFTFVSTANAFMLKGAKIVFVDSLSDHPNMDVSTIEALITPKTKAIVPIHYAGVACDMDGIMALADRYNLFVVEDAAQAIDAWYINSKGEKRALGSIGHLATFSFHETKNVISGEGGMLAINDEQFVARAEIIWEKGTNRAAFWRGEVDKYGWVDIGSSFLPSEMIAAFLWAQLQELEDIQQRRLQNWEQYYDHLSHFGVKGLPQIPLNTLHNGHIFYLIFDNLDERSSMIDKLKSKGINAVFHYLSLHTSKFFHNKHDGRELPNADRFTDTLLRLPMYYDLDQDQIRYISQIIDAKQ